MNEAQTILLVGCGKSKLPHPAAARDLYTGNLFRSARGYAEASGRPWLILSALHGVVEPEHEIDPYDLTMADRIAGRGGFDRNKVLPEMALRAYHEAIAMRLWWWLYHSGHTSPATTAPPLTLEIHAGKLYVEAVRRAFELAMPWRTGGVWNVETHTKGHQVPLWGTVEIAAPLEGLEIGERLAWYAARREAPESRQADLLGGAP